MRNKFLLTVVLMFAISFIGCNEQDKMGNINEFPVLDGPYLGQKPPGMTGEIFAPGKVSTGMNEGRLVFNPDGTELFMGITVRRSPAHYEAVIINSKQVDGKWSDLEVAEFSGIYSDMAPCLHPNGSFLVFQSNRPTNDSTLSDEYNFWYIELKDGKWSEPLLFSKLVNGYGNVYGGSIAANGNFYFTREEKDGSQKIYRSKFIDDKYIEPELLPETVNSVRSQFDGYISPDESYMILPVYGRKDAIGSTDYYITFRNQRDEWSEVKNLGPKFNTRQVDGLVSITADSKYIFYCSVGIVDKETVPRHKLNYNDLVQFHNSYGHGSYDVYWVDAKAIEQFRPKGF